MNILAQATNTLSDDDAAALGAGIILLFVFIGWIVPMIVGWLIGKKKGRAAAGFFFPFFLGWIGVIIVACLQSDRPQYTQVNVVTNPGMYQQPHGYQPQQVQQRSGQPLPPPGQ